MENQHQKIKGYRELNQEEIDLMNRIKEFGPMLQVLTDDLDKYLTHQLNNLESEELERFTNAQSHTWLWEGKIALQKGLMALTRSVAQPTFF